MDLDPLLLLDGLPVIDECLLLPIEFLGLILEVHLYQFLSRFISIAQPQ